MRKHKHSPYRWDGYHEHCKCGVSSAERTNPETGTGYMSFSEWPEEA